MASDRATVALELEFAANGLCFSGGCDENCSYWLSNSAAGGAGDPGYCYAIVGFGDFTDVFGQSDRYRPGNRAVLVDHGCRNFEEQMFGEITVDYCAQDKEFGTSRTAGQN